MEKRKHVRIDSQNLTSLVSTDENDLFVYQCMGRTLNVSESGILLETFHPMEINFLLELTIAFQDQILEFKGRVVRCIKMGSGWYETGVEFTELDDDDKVILLKFIKLFNERQTQKE